METLGTNAIMVFDDANDEIINCPSPGLPLAAGSGHEVTSYRSLLRKVAALSYYNPRFKLLFRGQSEDHKVTSQGGLGIHSSLYPTILRQSGPAERLNVLRTRFEVLEDVERQMGEQLGDTLGSREIRRNRVLRWAIAQHYDLCPTPFLDVTQSLQTALSFPLAMDHSGYLYVFAFPQLTGIISVSAETRTQVVDLAQVCPPDALRPHFQMGCVVGDYPEITKVEFSHGGCGKVANNFACRLLTKFRLNASKKWRDEGFIPTPSSLLFPDKDDVWAERLKDIRVAAKKKLKAIKY